MKRIGACSCVIFRRESKLLMSSGPNHRQDGFRHIAGRGEGCLQDHTSTLVSGREVNSRRGAQRLAVHYDLLGSTGLQKVVVRGLSVSIEPILRRPPSALDRKSVV